VHWAYGGKGMQTGLQDAGNLGWKLAAQIHGWAPPDLLDTYHSERHPIGQRLMTFSRAQEALARPGEHVTALRELFARFLTQEQTFRAIAEEITDVDICYPVGPDGSECHPLFGRWAPNLVLNAEHGKTCVADIMCAGKGVLLDLAARPTLKDAVAKWADRIESVTARCYYQRPANLDAMLSGRMAMSPGWPDRAIGMTSLAARWLWPCRNGSVTPDSLAPARVVHF
jgi:FAD binding domain